MFKRLGGQLDEQLAKWTQIKTDDVPKIGAAIKQLDLPVLAIDEKRAAGK